MPEYSRRIIDHKMRKFSKELNNIIDIYFNFDRRPSSATISKKDLPDLRAYLNSQKNGPNLEICGAFEVIAEIKRKTHYEWRVLVSRRQIDLDQIQPNTNGDIKKIKKHILDILGLKHYLVRDQCENRKNNSSSPEKIQNKNLEGKSI